MNQRITFGEWLPDQSPMTGALTVAENVYSKAVGYGAISSIADYSGSAPENLNSVFSAKDNNGNTVVFAGGNDGLYRLDSTDMGFENVSKGYVTVTTVARTSDVVTITTSAAHGYATSDSVVIALGTNTSLNGTYTITGTPTTTTFTYAKVGTDITSGADTGSAFVKYATPSGQRWRFIQFGNNVIAANGDAKLQSWNVTSSTKFQDLAADAPEARYLTIVRDFVVSGYPSSVDNFRAQWSALGDETSWTTSPTTQADFQDVYDGGQIMGVTGGEFGLVLLEKAIVRMTYVGSPIIFQFDNISRTKGCYAPNSIVQFKNTTFFLSDDGFYACDGQNVLPIGAEKVDRYFFSELDDVYIDNMSAAIDPIKSLVIWAYPKKGSGGHVNKLIIYNYNTQKWSSATTDVDFLSTSASPTFTLEGLDTISTSIDLLETPLDSRVWIGGKLFFSGVRGDKIISFTGSNSLATITTGDISSENIRTAVTMIKPIVDNGSASAALFSRDLLSTEVVFGSQSAASSEDRISVRGLGKYHRIQVTPTGNSWLSAIGIDVEISPLGGR
jgi:hypothetical protein